MTSAWAYRIEGLAWSAWLFYWLLAAARVKQLRRRASDRAHLLPRILMLLAALLFFTPAARLGPFAWRFLPAEAPVLWAGLALTFAGLGVTVWARVILAGNWSSAIVLRTGHELVCAGPYALVRHPIYAGSLVAFAGAALVLGQVNGWLALGLLAAGFWVKARREESLLVGEFGPALDAYRSRTGMFFPRWRPLPPV